MDECPLLARNGHSSPPSRRPLWAISRLVHRSEYASSFDYLVGGYEHGVRHDQRERLGGLAIDDHHELGWLHDGQVGGLLAFQNPGD